MFNQKGKRTGFIFSQLGFLTSQNRAKAARRRGPVVKTSASDPQAVGSNPGHLSNIFSTFLLLSSSFVYVRYMVSNKFLICFE
jgi:hypothetical protein